MERSDLSRDAGDRLAHAGRCERWDRRDWFAIALIVLATGLIGLPGISDATLGWSDAPLHLFDGKFVRDFVRAWPIENPRAWAEQFYLRHPAIGIGVYYPPGFAAIEAVVFSIFGVSVVSARALVVAFAAGACVLLFNIGKNWFGRTTGLFAVAFLLTMPHAVFWMRDVMLEWPATFGILTAVAAYQRDSQRPRAVWALATWAAVLAAFLTKQTAGFIGPVIAAHAMLMPTRSAYWSRIAPWTGITIAASCIATYTWITRDITALASRLVAWSPDFLFYPRHLPEITGWLFVGLTLVAVCWLLFRLRNPAPAFLAMAIGTWFLFSSMIEAKEPRYFFFALPFLAMSVAAAIGHPLRRPNNDLTSLRESLSQPAWSRYLRALFTGVVIVQAWLFRFQWPAELPNYVSAATALCVRRDADLVLVDAVRDGQLIYDFYDSPLRSDHVVIPLRASKLLYARAAREKYNYQQFVESPAEIVALLDRYGIRYIVMESQLPDTPYRDADPPPRQMLRTLVQTDPRFKLWVDQSLACGDPSWKNMRLRVYEYTACPPRTSDSITLSMPGMGGSITLKLPATQPVK